MRAIKAFNRNLQATLGSGMMTMEAGKTYREKEAKCAHNGFHCAENPLCALGYYNNMDSRFFIVEAGGDINQDGNGTRISCTELTLIKEITRIQLAALACEYIRKYPDREEKETHLCKDKGAATVKEDFIIVRGKNPIAKGVKDSYLFLLKEEKNSHNIQEIYPVYVDGKQIKANVYYGLRGGKLCIKKN